MAQFARYRHLLEAFRWNPPQGDPFHDGNGQCKPAKEIRNTIVRPTSYREVHAILGTSGCSKECPWWDWSVLGIVETKRGSLVVYPGDYVVTDERGNVTVEDAGDFLASIEMRQHDKSANL